MMQLVGAIRPSDWELPLLLHVLGAMLLVGALVTAITAFAVAWRGAPRDVAVLNRFGFRTLVYAAIPAFILVRLSSEWIASEEGLEDADLTWIDIGYQTADPGGVVLLVTTVLSYLGTREPGRPTLSRVALVLACLLLIAYLVAVWAMTTKPD
jgi:hypothetical protein